MVDAPCPTGFWVEPGDGASVEPGLEFGVTVGVDPPVGVSDGRLVVVIVGGGEWDGPEPVNTRARTMAMTASTAATMPTRFHPTFECRPAGTRLMAISAGGLRSIWMVN